MKAHPFTYNVDCHPSGAEVLVLWLDCDREGENICFEVMDNVVPAMRRPPPGGTNVFRARFSAISAPEIKAALDALVAPNKDEALAVDARQELDLKVTHCSACLDVANLKPCRFNADEKL